MVDQTNSVPAALAFLHGAGMNREMWRPQTENLEKDFAILAIDLPGHGELRDTPFSLATAVEATAQCIAEENCGRVVTVGLSLGGYVAIAHAAKHPEQIAGIILSGCCVQYFGLIGLVAAANTFALRFVSAHRFEVMQTKLLRSVATSEVSEEVARRGFSIEGARNGLKEVIGKDFVSMIKDCPAPVVVINGERDTLNRKYEERFIAARPNMSLEILSDCGHLCSLERPDRFSSLVRRFAQSVRD